MRSNDRSWTLRVTTPVASRSGTMLRLLARAKVASASFNSRLSAWNSKSRLSPADGPGLPGASAPGAPGAFVVMGRGGGAGQASKNSGGTVNVVAFAGRLVSPAGSALEDA